MKSYPNIWELERLTGVTWQDLVELEPRLGELLLRARQAGANCLYWADVDRVFPSIRKALFDLVGSAGHHHSHPVLGSAGATVVACWKLYDAVAGWVQVFGDSDASKSNEARRWANPVPRRQPPPQRVECRQPLRV
jgi:hypothetical protein